MITLKRRATRIGSASNTGGEPFDVEAFVVDAAYVFTDRRRLPGSICWKKKKVEKYGK